MTRCRATRSRCLVLLRGAILFGVVLLGLWPPLSHAQPLRLMQHIGTDDLDDLDTANLARFGLATTALGDLNGDGVPDIAALSMQPSVEQGALWVLFLNADGTVKERRVLTSQTAPRLPDVFGWGLSALGDLDGNGTLELILTGAQAPGGLQRTYLTKTWLLSLTSAGDVDDVRALHLPDALQATQHTVQSFAAVGDVDGDGRTEVAAGVTDQSTRQHSTLLLFLGNEANVRAHRVFMPGQDALRALPDVQGFGEAVAPLGDLDGDGIPDLAVGAVAMSGQYEAQGAVAVLFLRRDGTVREHRLITQGQGGFTDPLQEGAGFGGSLASVGDLDGDGRLELAVAATRYDGFYENQGSTWVLFLRADGAVRRHVRLGTGSGGFEGFLPPRARFGFSMAAPGDLNGDGAPDLIVRADRVDAALGATAGLWSLLLRPDGTTWQQRAIHAKAGGLLTTLHDHDYFGFHAVRIGDVDGNGVEDLAVGAPGGQDRGALWILLMDAQGQVIGRQLVNAREGGFTRELPLQSTLGTSVAALGDIDDDGVPDLAVSTGVSMSLGVQQEQVWVLLLNRTGAVKRVVTLPTPEGMNERFPFDDRVLWPLPGPATSYGESLARVGDLDGNGVTDLIVGSLYRDAVVLLLNQNGSVLRHQRVPREAMGLTQTDNGQPEHQYSLYGVGDLDGNGHEEVAIVSVQLGPNDLPIRSVVRLLSFDRTGAVTRSQQVSLAGLGLREPSRSTFRAWFRQSQAGRPDLNVLDHVTPLAVYPLGDLNRDGTPDIALRVHPALLENPQQGNLWQFYMRPSGTVKRIRRLPFETVIAVNPLQDDKALVATSVVRLDPDAMGAQPVLGLGLALHDAGGIDHGRIAVVALEPAYRAWLAPAGYSALALGGLVLLITLASRVQTRRLRRKNQALEQIVAERTAQVRARTAEVAAQAQALQRANDIKAHFLANISHEFRTPLTLTFGPIQDLLAGHYASLDQAHPHFERAQRNGQRLLRLINQLLDLAKMDAGSLELRLRRIDASQLVREIVGLFTSLAERQGLALTAETPEHLWLTCDPDHLEKMLVNLISNAFKFTPTGGAVTVTLHAADEAAVLAVSDTGMGISAEEQRYVFERFYQVDGSTRRAQDGTGIGLALVKELVTLHEGTITVESGEGQGTTFTITLPHRDAPALAEGTAAPADLARQPHGDGAVLDGVVLDGAEPMTAGTMAPDFAAATAAANEEAPVVVLVEDHADLRAYIRSHLDPSFVILEAANGADGLALAQEQVPDLILSDVMMPKMDGYALLEALKQDQRTSHIPVVLLTARADVESRIAGLERGADAYLAKPFDAGELTACLRGLIAQRRHLHQLWRTGAETPSTKGAAAADALPVPEQQFLARLDAVLAARFADPSFGADAVAAALGLTPRQLLRKLKALTGQTTSERLRLHRLAVAHQLLRTTSTPVKAVVFAVGFTSGSYFAKQFKQAYGVTPSAHRATHAAVAPD